MSRPGGQVLVLDPSKGGPPRKGSLCDRPAPEPTHFARWADYTGARSLQKSMIRGAASGQGSKVCGSPVWKLLSPACSQASSAQGGSTSFEPLIRAWTSNEVRLG